MSLDLPRRAGARPSVSEGIPQQQIGDNPDAALHQSMKQRFLSLFAEVDIGPSRISVPGATALFLPEGCSCNQAGLMIATEFAHIHPPHDGSFHMILSEEDCALVLERGWGELHPLARTGEIQPTVAMVYAPRDEAEVEVILRIAAASHQYAASPAGR